MATNDLDGHVHKYLDILQTNIQRMSLLSNTCKAWCTALISAMLLFLFKEKEWDMVNVLWLPVGLFYVLDAYYLSIEREFISLSKAIMARVQQDAVKLSDVYVIDTSEGWKRIGLLLKAMFWSWATLPFYGTIAVVLLWIAQW